MNNSIYGISQRHHRLNYIYAAWLGIKARCLHSHSDYSDRGIRIHGEWVNRSDKFIHYILENLGERPTILHSIDRIDNDGHYEPNNLKWSTESEQQLNTRRTLLEPYIYRNGKYWYVSIKGKYLGSRTSYDEAVKLKYRGLVKLVDTSGLSPDA